MRTITITAVLYKSERYAYTLKTMDPEGTHFAMNISDHGGTISEAVNVAQRMKPDMVWVDASLPAEVKTQLAEELREASPKSDIVYISDVVYSKVHKDLAVLHVQCFGNFEVFNDEKTVRFSRSLSKEAFAYLVDRRGADCTVGELCGILWEDKVLDTSLKSQCRVIMASLKKDLEKIGRDNILIKKWNTWSVDTSKFSCDYYDYLNGSSDIGRAFKGEYMSQYSWAELTTGNLVLLNQSSMK